MEQRLQVGQQQIQAFAVDGSGVHVPAQVNAQQRASAVGVLRHPVEALHRADGRPRRHRPADKKPVGVAVQPEADGLLHPRQGGVVEIVPVAVVAVEEGHAVLVPVDQEQGFRVLHGYGAQGQGRAGQGGTVGIDIRHRDHPFTREYVFVFAAGRRISFPGGEKYAIIKRKGVGIMKFTFAHNNLNVLDLDKSLAFYREALGLEVAREKEASDHSFKLVYLSDGVTPHQLELTWLRDRTEPYDLGDNEIHLAFVVEDFDAAHALHEKMGCICYENPGMGIYFISDPDGYWLEIVPKR